MIKSVTYHINLFFATGFYTGFFPKAPGTAGSIAALTLWYLLEPTQTVQISLIVATFIIGVYSSGKLETTLGKDASIIVIDEFTGLFISLFLAPQSIPVFLCGFILFRFFDILKPLGINKLQDIKGGFGVMLDDVVAGLYSLICLKALLYFDVF
jgi:phosphatidylglycerophosphatase A